MRKVLPFLVVAATVAATAYWITGGALSGRSTFSLEVYWPRPSEYSPGAAVPSAFLEINYTGFGSEYYGYVVTRYSATGVLIESTGSALVSSVSPFRAYFYLPPPSGTTTTLQVEVYRGTLVQGDLVFAGSVPI